MGRLIEDMVNLRDEIEALRIDRGNFITRLKHDISEFKSGVAVMQQGFREDHTQMADRLKDELELFASGISSSVTDLMNLFKDDRIKMAGNMRADLQVFMAGLRKYIADLEDGVAELQSNFRRDHRNMGDKLKNDLQIFVAGIKSSVSDLEEQFRNEHFELTGKARAERNVFLTGLKRSVADLKLQTNEFMQVVSDELTGARRAWSAATPFAERIVVEKRKPTRVPAEPKVTAPPAEVPAEPEMVEPPVKEPEEAKRIEEAPLSVPPQTQVQAKPDDLTQIRGIGPGLSKRLNKAGIFTFAALASKTAHELQGTLGDLPKFVKVEKWIQQAKELNS